MCGRCVRESEGTLSVVPVMKSVQRNAGQRAGQGHEDDERIEPGLEIDHDLVVGVPLDWFDATVRAVFLVNAKAAKNNVLIG